MLIAVSGDALPADASSSAPVAALRFPEPDWIKYAADERGWAWARIMWARACAQQGSWFDAQKADRVVEAWPRWFKLTTDRFRGEPFYLNEWQEISVRLLVGWKVPEDVIDPRTRQPRKQWVRLFREYRLWIARKGGKTEFLAALGLLFFVYEKIPGAEGFVFAKDEEQGKVPFRKMCAMIALSKDLSEKTEVYKKSIYVPEIDGSIMLLSGTPEGKHGKNPTVILGDEMHEWLSTELRDTLRQGTGTRLQPIQLYASTAGLKTNPTGMQLFEESQDILEGKTETASCLVVIFAADPDDDPFVEATWHKANPSLGITPTFRFMREEAAAARGNPRKEAHFKCYHLNIWVDAETRWIPAQKWAACAADPNAWRVDVDNHWARFKGRRCVGALDVSATQDLTALVWRFERPDSPIVDIVARFWCPADTLARRERESKLPWRVWAERGAIETTPGDYVDQNYVQQAIEESLSAFEVDRIGYDSWNAKKLVGDLMKSGLEPERLVEMRQGIQTLGGPSKEFETRVFAGNLDHGGHPILKWMAGHTIIRFDENLNFKPSKKRSADKIDGIVCCVMAEGLAMKSADPEGAGIF